ncbi:HNH endonuclease [Bordetella bronchiseptica]|uniref:HNH endonuclease n=1 Tax=Bordetella bronchiseptica TaxID=518 RepID=UPI001F369810|nr:HNH endonuclease [Bordetella bronchiseptica]
MGALMTPLERFLAKVERAEGCWQWKGAKKATGYGNFYLGGKVVGAHCASFRLLVGEIPAGMYVCHSCDTPSCVNPAHLFLGTPAENQADMARKGRAVGVRQGREHHPMAKLNTAQVEEIRARRAVGEKLKDIARAFGVTESNVSVVANRRSWA